MRQLKDPYVKKRHEEGFRLICLKKF